MSDAECDHAEGRPHPACHDCHSGLNHDPEPIVMSKPEDER